MAHRQRHTRKEPRQGRGSRGPGVEAGPDGPEAVTPTPQTAPDVVHGTRPERSEESVQELVQDLVNDVSDLVRHEVNLAKLELRESAREVGRGVVKGAIAAGVAAVGGLAFTAFLILGLGVLLGGMYWLSALIVGAVYLAIAGVLAQRARSSLRPEGLRPDETLESLKEDREFARREAREFKRDVMS